MLEQIDQTLTEWVRWWLKVVQQIGALTAPFMPEELHIAMCLFLLFGVPFLVFRKLFLIVTGPFERWAARREAEKKEMREIDRTHRIEALLKKFDEREEEERKQKKEEQKRLKEERRKEEEARKNSVTPARVLPNGVVNP